MEVSGSGTGKSGTGEHVGVGRRSESLDLSKQDGGEREGGRDKRE